MARKPETQFIAAVHRHLDPRVYREKMCNPFRGGTPDMYYEGPLGICWIEYKWSSKTTLNVVDLSNLKVVPHVSALQQKWLMRAHGNGVSVAVVVGVKSDALILVGLDWQQRQTYAQFQYGLMAPFRIAQWIAYQVLFSTPHQGATQ